MQQKVYLLIQSIKESYRYLYIKIILNAKNKTNPKTFLWYQQKLPNVPIGGVCTLRSRTIDLGKNQSLDLNYSEKKFFLFELVDFVKLICITFDRSLDFIHKKVG